jgi:pSer/pThr/pTyr-binding forkhead associated (FHA) protein/outer membrane biosynthesis protein TonB
MQAPSKNEQTAIRLEILGPTKQVLLFGEYLKDKLVIGRILSADLRIDDPRVSRIHALIEAKNGQIVVTDLASTHGTFVNDQKIIESKLNWGDVIRLGLVEVRVQKGSGKTVAPANISFDKRPAIDGETTQLELDREELENKRQPSERRKKDVLPDENRLDERRSGERRGSGEQRSGERRKGDGKLPANIKEERRSGKDRRQEATDERRVGERRRIDRRIFDITSLERRIEERRSRRNDDDLLGDELEKAFTPASHGRELEVTALWGDHILDVSNFADPVVLTAGESPKNHYIIPSEGIPDEFPLISLEDDGTAYLAFTDQMQGTVRAKENMYTLDSLRNEKFVKRMADYYVVSLKQDDFAKVSIGSINFFALYVRPAPRIKAAPLLDKDPLLMRTFIGSILFLVLLFTGVSLVPQPKPVTIEMIPERYAKIVIKKRPVIKPPDGIVAKNEDNKQGGSVMGEGGRPPGEEGKVGKQNLPPKETPQAILPKSKPKEKPPEAPKQAAPAPEKPKVPPRKVVDANKAKSVGLLKAFSQSGLQKEFKSLLDTNEGPEGKGGFDEFGKAVSGLRGKTIEETGGAGGKGLKGVDIGGGGKTVGIDGPSTKGLGRGYEGSGIGEGLSGPGRLGQKGEHAISIISENVQVLAGLPKDVINAVVQRHRPEIRGCYDSALQRNPKLRGKIVVAFNIQPNGIVSYAGVKESTLGDGGLENCIVSRIKTWVFPKPEAPVVTEVTAYPFYLSPSN